MIELNTVAVMVTIIVGALVIIWRNRADITAAKVELKTDMTEMESRLKSDMTEMKADIKTTDDRLRSVDRNVARIGGFLEGRIPDFIQEPDRETTTQEEQVSEVVGD